MRKSRITILYVWKRSLTSLLAFCTALRPNTPLGELFIICIKYFTYTIFTYTIRYGGRAVTEECPIAVMVMSFQSIVGVVIQVGKLSFNVIYAIFV